MEDEIKKVLIENLFACTESKELTKDRIVEIASEIVPFVVKVVNEQLGKSANSDLESEIEIIRKYYFINSDFDKAELDGRTISNIARHFANWQKQQIMKDAMEGVITFDYYGDGDKTYGCVAHDSFCLEDRGLRDCDKVKIIVVKED